MANDEMHVAALTVEVSAVQSVDRGGRRCETRAFYVDVPLRRPTVDVYMQDAAVLVALLDDVVRQLCFPVGDFLSRKHFKTRD